MARPKNNHRAPPEPGTFMPGLPGDSNEVVRLFAVAGRVVCAQPQSLEQVTRTLLAVLQKLTPPERFAAEECARLWTLFGRMAQKAQGQKPALIEEGARALYRDLDRVGQKLDLAPLEPWASLPTALVAARPVAIELDENTAAGENLEGVRKKARGRRKPLDAQATLDLIASLSEDARAELYRDAVGSGCIGRSEVSLIEQLRGKGDKVGKVHKGDMVATALEQIGAWLREGAPQ